MRVTIGLLLGLGIGLALRLRLGFRLGVFADRILPPYALCFGVRVSARVRIGARVRISV